MTINFFIRSKKRKHPKVYLRFIDGKGCNIYCDTGFICDINTWGKDTELSQKLECLESAIVKNKKPFIAYNKEDLETIIRGFHFENSNVNDFRLFIANFIKEDSRGMTKQRKIIYNKFYHLYDEFYDIMAFHTTDLISKNLLREFEQFLRAKTTYNNNTIQKYLKVFGYFEKRFKGNFFGEKEIHQKTYLIKDDNKYKIGKSQNPEQRLSDLKTGNMNNLEIVHIIDRDIETELQRKFKDKIIDNRREWFSLSEEDIGFIKKIS